MDIDKTLLSVIILLKIKDKNIPSKIIGVYMKKKLNFNSLKGGPGNLLLAAVVFFAIIFALVKMMDTARITENISYTSFLEQVENGNVRSVRASGNELYGMFKDGLRRFETVVPANAQIWDLLRNNNVDISIESPNADFSFWHIFGLFTAVMAAVAVWFFLRQSRGASGSGNNIFTNVAKSKAKMFLPSQIKVNFNSVAGAFEAKEELQDVVDFLKNPEKYRRLGAKLTRGVLLVGEPGNGKTLLARAVAGEANCPFLSLSGSDFVEMYVGVGAARVRDLFAQARRYAPSIIFIDEIDAVGRQRGSGLGGGHDEREQTLNQLLTEMDGFDTATTSVVVMAATNRVDVLDKALLRPGRFDRQVQVPYPDLASREDILEVHAKDVKISKVVNLGKIARGTPGFTGADLANLINEAAINASRKNQDVVNIEDFEEARDKILLGKQWHSVIRTEEERAITAYHEAGHAIITLLLPEVADPLYKVTIVPRGRSLGVTHSLPEREKHSVSKEEKVAIIKRALGGRAAEELVFNRLETGAYSDFQRASQIARDMVCRFGMSKALGPIVYEPRNAYGNYEYSEETARLIDEEVRALVDECYADTVKMLKDNRDKLDKLANALLEKETLYAGEIYALLGITPREEHLFH